MSWPHGNVPPAEEHVFFNGNGRHLDHGQVSNIDTASMVSLNLTFPPAAAEAPVSANMNGSHLHQGHVIIEQNTHFGSTLNQENEKMNPNVENSSRRKRRKLKSKVWDDFTKHEGEDGKEWAKCNHCQKKFVGSSKSGTTHLKNHLERCPSKRNPGGADKAKEQCIIDQELNGFEVVRKIIKYGLNSMKSDILNVYQEEKEKLIRYLNKLSCHFSLSIELLEDYYFLVLCFIDDSWELKKRIIHLQKEEYEGEFVKSLLVDFSIDKNIISMVDNTNEFIKRELTEINTWFRERGPIPFLGICAPLSKLLHKLDHDILYIELTSQCHIFGKARELRVYVKKTSAIENKFQIAVDKAKFMGKKVTSQGVPERNFWGFELLEWVMEFKEAFSEMEHIDPHFKSINFIEEDWDYATALYECWKVVRDAIRSLSDCKYNTTNVYFPIVCDIFLKLVQWEKNCHQYRCETISYLRKYFDEYWSNSNLILAISVVLDPRFKMKIVKHWYKKIHGDDANLHLNEIIIAITDIYNEYAKGTNNFKSLSSLDHGDANSSIPFKMLDAMGRSYTSLQHVNPRPSELDRYLKDSKCVRVEEFDLLAWWRNKTSTYPTLARMARDFLAISLYTFDNKFVDFPLINQIRNIFYDKNLDDDIKRPLICTKVWLYDLENR